METNTSTTTERQEIINGLAEILTSIPLINKEKLAVINEDTDFFTDLNTPSTQMIMIVAKAEQKFSVEFNDDDIDGLNSRIKSIVDLIVKRKKERINK